MNAMIVHQKETVLQPHTAAAEYFYSRNRSTGYWAGFMAYCNGMSLDELTDPAERAGWWGANKAEAAASMPVACDDDEYGDDIPSMIINGEWF